MWRTSHGDRVLVGDEAIVFLESVGYVRDMVTSAIDMEESHRTGVWLFDALQSTQQLVMLHAAAMALLKPAIAAPELTSTLEATVYAIYREMNTLIELEIDSGHWEQPHLDFRKAVLAGLRCPVVTEDRPWREFDDDFRDLPEIECDDLDVWEQQIESLADRVLWDRDFELESILADRAPMSATWMKQHLGIGPEYFSSAAPDASNEKLRQLDEDLIALRSIPPHGLEPGY